MKTIYIIFFSFLVTSNPISQEISNSSSPGFPLITNYLPKDYSANVQNWSVIQDKRGVLYFGNGSGILEYDGASWRLISIPNDVVRCFAIDKDGKIFVGGINEFGYLETDSVGTLKYISLNKFISKEKINFGDVWRIVINDDGIYLQTFSILICLKLDKNINGPFLEQITKNPSIKKWESKSRINPIHSIDNRIFVHERNIGLQELIDDKLVMLAGGEQFAQDLICIMLPFPSSQKKSGKILVGSLRRGMFLYDGKIFEKFNNEADNYLIQNRLYFRGAILGDGTFALGTQVGGIVVIDEKGKLRTIINKNTGLNNETIWDLFADREGNLWAAMDNGIAKILYPSSLQILDEKSGFEGTIQSITNYDGKIFLATSSGIYYLENHEGHKRKTFIPLKNTTVQSWDFLRVNNTLLAATNDGVFEIRNKSASLKDYNLRYVYCLYQSVSDSSIIYAGLHNGLAVLKYSQNEIKDLGRFTQLEDGIDNIEEDNSGNLWLTSIAGKIIRIKIPLNKMELNGYRQETVLNESLIKSKIKMFRFRNEIFYYDHKNIFSYEYSKNKFFITKYFSHIFNDTTQQIVNIYCDSKSILWWVAVHNGKVQLFEVDLKEKPPIKKIYSFLEIIADDFSPDFSLLKFFIQEDIKSTLWASSGNILINYDVNSNLSFPNKFSLVPLIRKVSYNGSNIIFNGYQDNNLIPEIPEISYSNNSLIFEFSSASFLKESMNDYQFLLEGFDEDWSNWTKETKKEYTNLPSGTYTFKIRSRSFFGKVSSESMYEFKILSPWFRTWWANLLAVLIIIFLFNYIIRFRVRFLNNKNIMLEKLVNERTTKINEQKEILEKQAQKLLELDLVKSNFFANISHEFRTPLTLIKGQLENVLGIVKDEIVLKKLNIAFSNSNKLNRLINQVLDLSKLESGKIQLNFEMIDLVSLIRNRIASFDSLANQKEIKLEMFSKIDSLYISIDREKIEEVIDNLLSNSFKFSSAGGSIIITIDKEKSDLLEYAIISIEDTGIGISEEKLPKIFDRFYQIDSSSVRQFEGSGLGLTIVKELIELHGGSIKVESILGKGTKFIISLPVEETQILSIEEQVFTYPEEMEDNRELILIVEDNIDVRSYIKENLEKNYRIEEAKNGDEGISKAIDKTPDLIITDVMMPLVDGFELCSRLKTDQRTSHIPIIILTAKADEKSKLDGLQIGADEFLAKPFSPKELEIRVGNLIKIRQLLREKYKEISVLKPEDLKVNSLDKEFLSKVFIKIKEHIEDNQFSVQKLAEEIGMSVSQLNRKLNALINQSAGKLIRLTRLDYASQLLEKNAGNITEIAYRIGFSDLSSFTHSFKEKFGITPSEYVKKLN